MADTGDAPRTLGELALEVRSKNAGPFWMTLEAFMPDEETYSIADAVITTELISELYHVAPASLQIFRIPDLHVVKVSFPRPVVQGSLRDRDMHAGQHHVPLASVVVPSMQGKSPLRPSRWRPSRSRCGGAGWSRSPTAMPGSEPLADKSTDLVAGGDTKKRRAPRDFGGGPPLLF
jgi:hypothetical protein